MHKSLLAAVALIAAACGALPAAAHHSFAMFDQSKELVLKDVTVVEWQWTNPHTWLFVLVPNGTPNPDKFSIEGSNPGVLRRMGFGPGTFKAGDKITIYYSPLKSGEKGGSLLAAVRADGKFIGEHLAEHTVDPQP